MAFDPQGGTLASGSYDKTVKLWEARSGKLLRTLEGHTEHVDIVAFSPDGRLLASKSRDHTIRLWSCETWETVAVIPEPTRTTRWIPALAFHPTLPLLAAAGSEPGTPDDERCRLIHLWELDLDVLLASAPRQRSPTPVPRSCWWVRATSASPISRTESPRSAAGTGHDRKHARHEVLAVGAGEA